MTMRKIEGLKKEKGSRNGGGRGRGQASRSDGSVEAPIGDARFSRLHTDPRFQRLPKNKAKVSIDSRFAHMFTEKGFNDPSVNKRGIKSKSRKLVDPLRRYYKVDEEEDEDAGLDGDTQFKKSTTKKTRGKKNRTKKDRKELGTKQNVEIYSEEELGAADSEIDLHIARKQRRGKKNRVVKKNDARAGVKISEEVEDSGVELEEVDEELDGQVQRARAGKGSTGKGDSDEESDDDDESGLEEGQEEEEDEVSASSSSSSSSESESEVEGLSEAEDEEQIPTTNDDTRRLAVMNMDWEHIRAVHLLVLLRSFLPKGGQVYSVTIYPSQFGMEQMKEENVHGPKNIFRPSDEDDEEDEEGADPEKLREYEKAKLRYYYAVVECDSASTATHLYKNCDGLEFERTSNTLDLRYIPDEMEFECTPRDTATEIPVDFKPIDFQTRALQHSNVKLTWDDDEPVRVKALRRNFNRDELNEMDFRAYVASSSDSESEPGEDANTPDGDEIIEPEAEADKQGKVRAKYLSLLGGTEELDMVRGKKAEKGNIEIKFHTGLDELSEKLLAKAKKDKADETVWEAYLRRKKEKKNARRNKKAASDSDVSSDDEEIHNDGHNDDPFFSQGGEDTFDGHNDDPFFSQGGEDTFDDPFFNQDDQHSGPSKTRKGRESKKEKMKKDLNISSKDEDRKKKKEDAAREKKEAEKKAAELELLLLDDHMVQNGEEFPKVPSSVNTQTKQKVKKKKGAKGKSEELDVKIASSANYDDPRFASLFSSHHFALDPTDPHYKKTGSHVAEMQRQRFQSSKIAQEQLDNSDKQEGGQDGNRKRKAELSSLVRSLKSKVQAKAHGSRLRIP